MVLGAGFLQLMSNTVLRCVGFSHLFVIMLFEEPSSGCSVKICQTFKIFPVCIYKTALILE